MQLAEMLPGADLLNALSLTFEHVWLASEGREIMVSCPYCALRGLSRDKSGHLALNADKNVGHCVRCDWGTRDLRSWLAKRNINVHLPLSMRSLNEIMASPKIPATPDFQNMDLPRGCRPMGAAEEGNPYGDSLLGKNLEPGDWMAAEAQACYEGFLDGYVVFPFFEEGSLVYWQARAARGDIPAERRKWNPSDVRMGKSHWLYGFDYNLPKNADIYLTEGTLDRISLQKHLAKHHGGGHYAFSGQGTALSFPTESHHPLNSQFGKLAFLRPRKVWVLYDPDAYRKAVGLAEALQMCGMDASAIRLTEQEGDPNEAGEAGLTAALERSRSGWAEAFASEIGGLKPA